MKYQCPYCKIGYAHTSGPIPNPTEWLIISDITFDSFGELIDTNQLYSSMGHMFECNVDTCNSFALFKSGFDKDPVWYHSFQQ